MALTAGVNLMLSPILPITFSQVSLPVAPVEIRFALARRGCSHLAAAAKHLTHRLTAMSEERVQHCGMRSANNPVTQGVVLWCFAVWRTHKLTTTPSSP